MNTISVSKSTDGKLTCDCSLCGNTAGAIVKREYYGNEYEVWQPCQCAAVRKSLKNINKSGLAGILDTYTFDTFNTPDEWQKDVKAKAQRFLTDHDGKWFGCFGQIGAGKTHLCTAICGELLKEGKAVRYMPWRDEIVPLRAMVTDDEDYTKTITELKKAEVLYIDDLFKTQEGERPTKGDINIAFELLNYRYNNVNLVTILSCERQIQQLMDIDQAVGSRIYQRCKDYCISIGYDVKKNWRLRK